MRVIDGGVDEIRFQLDQRKNAENNRKHGVSLALRTLVVCHCYREDDEIIRIISARKASRVERAEYERRWAR